jgi:hypothetical protein
MAMTIALMLSTMGMAFGAVDEVTPSTNDQNRTNGWAHFNVLENRFGEVDVEFVSTRNFYSCFEYRIDGADRLDPDNFNPAIHDGLWPYVCVYNSTAMRMFDAWESVEIRMVFGAETDERFDWTRVDVAVPGAHGLEIAKSGPAGQQANENARFKQGNDNAARPPGEPASEDAGHDRDHANENARFKQGNENAHFNR